MANASPTIRADPQVIHRRLGSGSVLLHSGSGQYHELNELATFIWETIENEPITPEELATAARLQFPDAPNELEEDVAEFIESLRARGLLEIHSA